MARIRLEFSSSDPHSITELDGNDDTPSPGKTDGDAKQEPAKLPRKKLPWLEGQRLEAAAQRTDAEQAIEKNDDADVDTTPSPSPSPSRTIVLKDGTNAPKIDINPPVSRTQTPSPRTQLNVPSPRSRSVLGPNRVADAPPATKYISSEYSSVPSDSEPMATTLPIKDPASYEKLVRRPSAPPPRPSSGRALNHSSQSEHESSPRNMRVIKDDFPNQRGTVRPKPVSSRILAQRASADNLARPRRCKSCDTEIEQAMPTARELYLEHKDKAQVVRKHHQKHSRSSGQQTLHELPHHLMAHSSSSSQSNAEKQLDLLRRAVTETFGRMPPEKGLARAVTVHGDLLSEAESIAREAVARGYGEEALQAFHNSDMALVDVEAATYRPPPLSPPRSLRSSESSVGQTYGPPQPRSRRTSAHPQAFTKSAKPKRHLTATGSKFKEALSDDVTGRNDRAARASSSGDFSMTRTPPQLYLPRSADSIVKDFAYFDPDGRRRFSAHIDRRAQYGAAADFYGDHGESVAMQPGVRKSYVAYGKQLPAVPLSGRRHSDVVPGKTERVHRAHHMRHLHQSRGLPDEDKIKPDGIQDGKQDGKLLRPPAVRQVTVESIHGPAEAVPPILREKLDTPNEPKTPTPSPKADSQKRLGHRHGSHHGHAFMQSAYYRTDDDFVRKRSAAAATTDSSAHPPLLVSHNWSLKHPRRNHVSLKEGEGYSLGRFHKRQPIARE